jgi:hypothetical protein
VRAGVCGFARGEVGARRYRPPLSHVSVKATCTCTAIQPSVFQATLRFLVTWSGQDRADFSESMPSLYSSPSSPHPTQPFFPSRRLAASQCHAGPCRGPPWPEPDPQARGDGRAEGVGPRGPDPHRPPRPDPVAEQGPADGVAAAERHHLDEQHHHGTHRAALIMQPPPRRRGLPRHNDITDTSKTPTLKESSAMRPFAGLQRQRLPRHGVGRERCLAAGVGHQEHPPRHQQRGLSGAALLPLLGHERQDQPQRLCHRQLQHREQCRAHG